MENRQGLRGYCTHRTFAGNRIPAPVQNLMMRDYCRAKGLMFKLAVNELYAETSTVILDNLVSQLDGLEGIVMVSYFILPNSRTHRATIYDHILSEGRSAHFVLENREVKTERDTKSLEEIFELSDMLKNCPRTIPEDLLPPSTLSTCFSHERD